MSLTLQETSKHSRLYAGFSPDGAEVGYSKTSIAPMNYESVIGSGNYDCPINLDVTRIQTAELDGYEMINADWHFRLQSIAPADSIVQPNTQRPAGTVGFGGRQGERWFYFRLRNVGYMHWPTRTIENLGGQPDYSETPTFVAKTRNLGTHEDVPDEIITANTLIKWRNIWNTPGGGELYLKWGVKQGKMKEEVVVNQAAREWLQANKPPSTPANETWFGFRFEIDVSEIPKIWRNGVVKDMDVDDFDDDEGGIGLTNALDELLAFMPLDEVYVGKKGGRRPLRKRFYKTGGQNYLMVAAKVSDIAGLLPGDLKFDPSMTQETITASANDCGQVGYSDFPDASAVLTRAWTGVGESLYYYGNPIFGNVNGMYRAGFRFTPNVPKGALFTRGVSAYARMTIYRDDYYAPYLGQFLPPPYVATSYWYADATNGNRPVFANDRIDSPEPGSNWSDGTAKTIFTVATDPGVGVAFAPIDLAAQMNEICALPDWLPNNGMRFRGVSAPATRLNSYPAIWIETYDGISAKAAVLDAFWVSSPAPDIDANVSVTRTHESDVLV